MKTSTMMLLLLGLAALLCVLAPSGMAGQGLSPPFTLTAVSVSGEHPESASLSPSLTIPAADWPQLQRDPQHTGTSSQQVNPPYRYYWRWNEVPFASRTQPVVADNRLFIGSLNGTMYALDADQDAGGGTPTILWSRDVGAPIRDTAAVYNGRVYFGAYDGRVHALDAATGNPVWSFQTGGGVAAAPVVDNGVVYIGSTDGVFYALDAATGALRWTYNAGAPILTSAALSADGQTVYFGAEDIYAYALRTSDGQLRWRTRLQGQSLAERWPVVVGNTVIYRSQPLRNFHFLLHEGDDVMDQAGAVNPNWAADWAAVRPRIVAHLTANPDRQTFFALDGATGALRGVAPVLYTYGDGDAPAPPVVKDGALYLVYRARHGIQTDGGSVHVTTRYDAELGRMDLSTLDITGLTATQTFNYQMRYTSDEPAMLSIGGNLLFVDNWERLGALNLQTGALIAIANVANYWPACPPPDGQCPAWGGPMPFFTTWPFPGPQVGEGVTHRPLVIASGRLFWRVVDGGLASIGPAGTLALSPATSGGSSLPLSRTAEEGPGVTATASLTPYVWTEPVRPVSNPPADLVQQLNDEVRRIVDAGGHLLPYFLERGFTTEMLFPGDTLYPEEPPGLAACHPGNIYWFDPGELVYTLSIAYPYLSSDLQSRVQSYLSAEMARYPPLEPLPWPPEWLTNGVARETYPVSFRPNCWPPPEPPLSTLYALWAYARYTGDWAYVQNRWSQIDALFDRKKGSIDSYAAISGAIGYARIARQLGRTADAAEGEQVAVQAMTRGLNFQQFLTTANARYPDPRDQRTGWRAPVFFGLVPEVGRYISDTNRITATAYLNDLTDSDGVFLWYITRLGLQAEIGESSFHGPDLAWSVFLAKAYVEGAGRSTLRRYLDRPWGLGDVYYLQKLVATIEATGIEDTTPPVISNVQVLGVTFYSATVAWQTDEPATSEVEYGLTSSYSSRITQGGAVTEHRVAITGLRPDTLYHFRVCSTSAGGRSCSGDGTFTTLHGYSLFLPVIFRK
ncbi:MAG: PQQ-binding-like beta-propeller repeat protein [Thermoflexales bacterium]|nr:PQQ-binding-like beta-propeller repeat protein [Thermoflexales bacterium]